MKKSCTEIFKKDTAAGSGSGVLIAIILRTRREDLPVVS